MVVIDILDDFAMSLDMFALGFLTVTNLQMVGWLNEMFREPEKVFLKNSMRIAEMKSVIRKVR